MTANAAKLNEITEARNVFAAELARLEALVEQHRQIVAAFDAQLAKLDKPEPKAQPEPARKPAAQKLTKSQARNLEALRAVGSVTYVNGRTGGYKADRKGFHFTAMVSLAKKGIINEKTIGEWPRDTRIFSVK